MCDLLVVISIQDEFVYTYTRDISVSSGIIMIVILDGTQITTIHNMDDEVLADALRLCSVSYTHLTLPTILLV